MARNGKTSSYGEKKSLHENQGAASHASKATKPHEKQNAEKMALFSLLMKGG